MHAPLGRALAIAQDRLGPRHHDSIATMINLADADRREGKWAGCPGAAAARCSRAERREEYAVRPFSRDRSLADRCDLARLRRQARQCRKGRGLRRRSARARDQRGCRAVADGGPVRRRNDAIAGLVRRQQDLKTSLETLDKRVTSELGQADGKRNDALIASLRAHTAQTRKLLEDVSAQLDRSFPAYAELSNPQPLSIAQTQGLLKPDENSGGVHRAR